MLKDMKVFIKTLISNTKPCCSLSEDVSFDSYFEGGNLEFVHKRTLVEYDLILKPDTNTNRHAHWFMFKVHKKIPGTLKFNIMNFMKNQSLIRKGMRPLAFSETRGVIEIRDLQYYKTFQDSQKFNTVSFLCDFHTDEWVCFSLCRHYSFTQLQNLYKDIEDTNEMTSSCKISNSKFVYSRELLCYSLGGLPVHLLTITGPNESIINKHKKAAIFTGRVHPGETVGSYVLENFIRFLLSDLPQALSLRNEFVFKIIPMLNPDGVVCGNSRTSLSGVDLNRIWNCPDPVQHPCVYYTKNFIQMFVKKKEVLMYGDFHGHGKKLGSFIYGCNKIVNGSFTSWTKVRLFPRILAKNSALFSYNECIFNIDPNKEGTGRIVIWKEIGISNSFTIETSLYGYHNGKEIVPHTLESYSEIGQEIGKSLLEYTHLLKTLEKELQLTGGWLKPNKFKEVSGTPALQILARKIETEKKELRYIDYRERAKTCTRPNSRSQRSKLKEPSGKNIDYNPYLDWKTFFNSEEVRIAQEKIHLGLESSAESSSTESSLELELDLSPSKIPRRPFSPCVDESVFWVASPHPLKPIRKERDPARCKFVKQHTYDFTGCVLDNMIVKNTSSDSFAENQRNMFHSRAERKRMHKERMAKTRSMSSKRDAKAPVDTSDLKLTNEKLFIIRPKVQKNYFFTKMPPR